SADPAPAAPVAQPVAETGFLTVDTTPWSIVSERGKALGQTPLVHVELSSGPHVLTLVNPELGIDQLHRNDFARQNRRQADWTRMMTDACWKAARPICLAVLLGGACLGKTTTTLAEERAAASGLAEAERAYQEVDFATMHDRATSALTAGGATRAETS